jgi:hypothetical protein
VCSNECGNWRLVCVCDKSRRSELGERQKTRIIDVVKMTKIGPISIRMWRTFAQIDTAIKGNGPFRPRSDPNGQILTELRSKTGYVTGVIVDGRVQALCYTHTRTKCIDSFIHLELCLCTSPHLHPFALYLRPHPSVPEQLYCASNTPENPRGPFPACYQVLEQNLENIAMAKDLACVSTCAILCTSTHLAG